MLLTNLLDHLARRFPEGATVLSAEITVSGVNHPAGLFETVSFEAEETEEDDDPDGGEKLEASLEPHLRLAACPRVA